MNIRKMFFKKQFFDLKNIFSRFIFREHFSLIQRFISLSAGFHEQFTGH